MGATRTLVSVEEYLHTDYEPDCDYVDGILVERNVGEKDHAKLQKRLLLYFEERCKQWNIFAIQELRVQVARTRYRVPDICVVLGPEPDEQILTKPPFLCIEVSGRPHQPHAAKDRRLPQVRRRLRMGRGPADSPSLDLHGRGNA